ELVRLVDLREVTGPLDDAEPRVPEGLGVEAARRFRLQVATAVNHQSRRRHRAQRSTPVVPPSEAEKGGAPAPAANASRVLHPGRQRRAERRPVVLEEANLLSHQVAFRLIEDMAEIEVALQPVVVAR